MNRLLTAALGTLLIAAAPHPGQTPPDAPAPDPLDLVITPADGKLGVRMTIGGAPFKAGDPIVRLPLVIVGIPSARYDGDALQARDDRGPVPLVQEEEPATPQGTYRQWKAGRDTRGPVVVTFAAPPRAVTAATNNGPLFDLRAENGGYVGAGVGFMATPVRSGPYRVRLQWDLPAGQSAVWSLGDREGDVSTEAPAEQLAFSYYAVGPLKTRPANKDSTLSMYWLTDPPFDAAALGERLQTLYGTMAAFFGEPAKPYHVYMRQNPYPGTGGTALPGGFAFGYNADDQPTLEKIESLVSHEIAHNWPAMQGEHGDTAWYSEGTAEYYSLLLSSRAGLLTPRQFVDSLNRKAYDYYTNPYRGLSNPEAAKIFWSDPTAQTIPYGRGMLYLMRTDTAIRAKSGAKRSLDDLVKEMRRRQTSGQSYALADWLSLVGAELGADQAKRDYDAMTAGEILVAPAGRLAPCLVAERHDEQQFELGFARASLAKQTIAGLVPRSEAAKAGVQDGDVVVASGDLSKIRSNPALPMTLTLRRDGRTFDVTYRPRGPTVEAWRWRLDPNVPAAKCVF